MIKRCGILLLLAWAVIAQTQVQAQTVYGIGYTAGQKKVGSGQTGVNYGVSTGAQTGATNGYKAIAPGGQVLVQTGMPLGVSYFPLVFGEELFASKGYFSGYVQLSWKINAMGARIRKFYIYRKPLGEEGDSTLMATVANDVYTWTDELADNSVLYKYTVFAQGVSDNLRMPFINYIEGVGFVTATGTVSGRITFEGGTAVEGVNVVAYADGVQGNKSVYLNGTNASMAVYHKPGDKELELSAGFTFQAWCRYDGGNRGALFSKGAGYNVSYQPGALKFTVGNATATLAFTPEAQQFFHVTAAFSPGKEIKLYVHHGENQIDSVVVNAGATPAANTDDIRMGRDQAGSYWQGYIDEMRLWNRVLPYAEVKRDFNRVINGTEPGIVGYWNLTSGIGDRFYDLARKGNTFYKNDGYLLKATWSATSPTLAQLSYRGVTDAQGNYSIAGFPYATNGSMYTFTPIMGVHQFEPAQALRSVGNGASIHNGVDFKDISSFRVSGTVRYRHSKFPVEGVSLLIDGKPVVTKEGTLVTTNNLGQFTIAVPIGLHNVRLSKNQHGFEFDGRFPKALADGTLPQYDFQKTLSGIDFIDATLVKVAGRVAGGPVQEAVPIGFGRSKNNLGVTKIYITSEKSYDITTSDSTKTSNDSTKTFNAPYIQSNTAFSTKFVVVNPDPVTGEFVTYLPPERYRVTSVTAGNYTFDASFHRTINLESVVKEMQTATDTLKAVQNNKPLPYPPYNAADYDSIWTVPKDGIVYTVGEMRFDLQSKQNFILRNTPALSVKNLQGAEVFGESSFEYTDNALGTKTTIPLIKPNGTYAFGHPVFRQRGEYKMVIDLFEEYTHATTGVSDRVPVVDGSIEIVNNLAISTDKVVEPVNSKGRLVYTFLGGLPETNKDAVTPANSYTRTLSMTAVSGNGGAIRTPWRDSNPFRGFVFGAMPVGNNFITTGPNQIVSILRDPPGSGSSMTLEQGQSTSVVNTWGKTASYNRELKAQFKLGMTVETFTGIGVGVVNSIGTIVNLETGLTLTDVWGDDNEETTTTEFATSYSTSGESDYVGAQADVFIGYATNIVYGDALNITPVPVASCQNCTPAGVQESDGFKIGTEICMRINPEFATTFVYTQDYIENTLIPNIETVRNRYLTYTGSPILANPPADRVVYLSKVAPGAEGYGTNNTDSATWESRVVAPDQKHDGPSYKLYVPASMESTFIDSVRFYNSQIAEWVHWLRYNEQGKVNAKQVENISFDAGSVYTKSKTSAYSYMTTRTYEFEVTESFAGTKGFEINKTNGVDVTLGIGSTQTGVDNEGNGTENFTTYSYTLTDPNAGDYMSVDVKDADGYSPVFMLRAGATKCPYEGQEMTKYYIPGKGVLGEATLMREKVSVSAQNAIVSNVPENRPAEFVLIMSNNSETNEDGWYTLTIDDATNPFGATIEIDGTPISNGTTSGRSFFIPAGTSLQKTLRVRKGGATTMDYPDLGLVLGSLCDGDVADTVKLSAHFTPGCSDIAISAPQDKWVLNSNVQPTDLLNVTIGNYDLNYGNFEQIVFQYRPSSTSQWTNERVFYNKKQVTAAEYANAPEPKSWVEDASIQYPFNMHALPDRTYEVRAVAVCVLGPGATAETPSAIMGGTKDVKRPVVFGTPQPGDGILQAGEDISIQFDEPIEASLLTPFNFSVKGVLNNNYQINDNTSITLDGDNDYVKVPDGLTLGKSFTAEFWMKRNQLNREAVVFSKGNASADAIQFGFTPDNRIFVEFAGQRVESSSVYTETDWHHYGIAYDQARKQVSVYRDGTYPIAQANVTGTLSGQGPAYLGKSVDGDRFAGVNVHEFRVWSEFQSMTKVNAQRKTPLTGDEINLAGYWPMDEAQGNKALDKARSRHALVFADWLVQPRGKSMQFQGFDYVNLKTQSTVSISDQMDMTLEFWFKGLPGQTATLFSSGRGDATDIFNTGNMSVNVDAAGKIMVRMNGEELTAADGGVMDENWHHLALVLQRNANTTLYMDGAQKASISSEHVGALTTQFGVWLGARGYVASGSNFTPSFDQHFRGYIDEFRIWKMARKVDQIQADAHARLQGNETGLVAYFPFERYEPDMGQKVLRETLIDQWNPYGANAGSAVASGAVFSDDVSNIKDARPLSNVDFTWAVNGDKIVITPTSALADIEKCILEITVSDVDDRYQNRLASPITWTAFVDKNPLKWDNDNLAFEKDLYAAKTFTVDVVNRGGTAHNYQIKNLPVWLKAQPNTGILAPASSITVTFTIDPSLNTGYFSEDIFLVGDSDLGIEEKLHLEVAVFAPAPNWTVDASKYQYSMNVIGQLKIEDIISTDMHDKVAAFVNNECRGVANLIYIEEFDRYEVFLDIFSNSEAGEKIELRVWDASKGAEYRNATPDFTFLANSLKGTPAMPVMIEAGTNVAKLFELEPGWNWVSFNVLGASMGNLNTLLAPLKPMAGDQIKGQRLVDVYNAELGWTGSLSNTGGFTTGALYMLKIQQGGSFETNGIPVSPTSPIAITSGWNWVGVNTQFNVSVNEALASLPSVTGDVMKGKRAFAIYQKGLGWIGSLKYLIPHEGYMLQSTSTGTLIYPEVTSLSSGRTKAGETGPEKEYWPVDVHAHANNMTIIARIDGKRMSETVVGAFAGNVCRGFATPVQVDNDNSFYFLTLQGDGAEKIVFKALNMKTNDIKPLVETVEFVPNRVLGAFSEPYRLTFGGADEASFDETGEWGVSPNPFSDHLTVKFSEPSQDHVVTITDMMGRTIGTFHVASGVRQQEFTNEVSALVPGVYMLTIAGSTEHHTVKLIKNLK
jgi:hypothetical protein